MVSRALEYAQKVISLSPDAVRATKRAINDSNLHGSIEEAWKATTVSSESYAIYSGKNMVVCCVYLSIGHLSLTH